MKPAPTSLDALAEEHLAWAAAQNAYAPNTLAARRRVLRSIGNPGTATREDIAAWWESRAHLERGTRLVDVSQAREFYKWCLIFNKRTDDPTIIISKLPKADDPDYGDMRMSNEQMREIADKLPDDLRRAVMLGAFAGLRISESSRLNWEDIDSVTAMIHVIKSKGNKSRYVIVSPELIHLLGVGAVNRKGNVLTDGGSVYNPNQLQRRINRALHALGAEFTSHDLRHRYGIDAYRSTGDLLAVAEQMGHGSVNTTKLYASADSEVKRKIAVAVMW